MRTRKSKREVFSPPGIEEWMCGRCAHWYPIGDEETAECSVLAISHRRGLKAKKQLPIRDTATMGDLKRAVVERTFDAMDGFEWREEGGGEVVPAEDFSGTPREYIDLNGGKQKIWSPLRSYAWGSCSRHDPDGKIIPIPIPAQEPERNQQLQLVMFGGDD